MVRLLKNTAAVRSLFDHLSRSAHDIQPHHHNKSSKSHSQSKWVDLPRQKRPTPCAEEKCYGNNDCCPDIHISAAIILDHGRKADRHHQYGKARPDRGKLGKPCEKHERRDDNYTSANADKTGNETSTAANGEEN
jgi:hypothetical protein